MFSQRTSFEQTPNRLSQLLSEVRAAGHEVLDLTASNPTQVGLELSAEALHAALATADATSYRPDCFGELSARQAVSDLWSERGADVDPTQIALTASTSEAYAALFKLFCDPGDRVLLPQPGYPLLAELARFEAIRLSGYRVAYDGAWHIDFPSLEQALGADAKAIVVVSPNNPTGSILRREELERLSGYGLPIICDEVFHGYPLAPARESVGAHAMPARGLCVALDGISKHAALPQLKAAWMTFFGDQQLRQQALSRLEFVLDTQLSIATPVQRALPALLRLGATRRGQVNERIRENLTLLDRTIASSALTRLHLEAGWYATLRLPSVVPESTWVERLLREHQVLVAPGWFFDFEEEPLMVVSLLAPRDVLSRGLERILAMVESAL